MIINKKIKSLIFIAGLLSAFNCIDSSAKITTVPYNLIGTNPDYDIDELSPPAYKIYGAKDKYGFADGTILYRQTFRDVTYYSPVPPPYAEEADGVSKKYLNWGFWDFKPNRSSSSSRLFRSSYYYDTVKVKTSTTPTVSNSAGSTVVANAKLSAGKVLNVLSITTESSGTEYVYFSTKGTGITNDYNGVGRIELSKVTPQGTKKKVYFPESESRTGTYLTTSASTGEKIERKCYNIVDNVKPYTMTHPGLKNTGHDSLTTNGLVKIPTINTTGMTSTEKKSNPLVACGLSGKRGDWRYLGLSSKGNLVVNPYFPAGWISYMGNGNVYLYDWASNRFEYDNFIKEYGKSETAFDKNKYGDEKVKVLTDMLRDFGLSNPQTKAKTLASKLSLLTNPFDETAVFAGVREGGGQVTRDFAVPVIQTRGDLYMSKITVKDSNGTIVAQGSSNNISSEEEYTFTQNSNYNTYLKRGQKYTVEVVLGNGTEGFNLKSNSLKTLVGTVQGSSSKINLDLPSSKLTTNKTLKKSKSSSGLTSEKYSKSNAFTYTFTVPESYGHKHIDFYAFVSPDHTGIDNLKFFNDAGALRVPVDTASGDIVPVSIELIDSKTGEVVYKANYDGSSSGVTRKAIIPWKTYTIKYTAKYVGDTIYESAGVIKKYKVELERGTTRKVGTALSTDSYTRTNSFTDLDGNFSIEMKNGKYLVHETDVPIIFQHPYLKASFKILANDKQINKNTANDSMSITLNDNYDISISNVKLLPSIEYVESGSRKVNYVVSYDATLTVPSYAKSSYQANTQTSIRVNDVTKTFIDQLKPGLNSGITHVVSGVTINKGTTDAEVVLNYNKASYESGNYDNNRNNVTGSVLQIKNPESGKNTDEAGSTNNSNNTSSDIGGNANNNCLIPRTRVSYTSNYTIHEWNSTSHSYSTFNGDKTISYKKYSTVSEKTLSNIQNTEELYIKDILFKSKYTTDKKLGAKKDGWVSMINSNDSIIKAGYGFELKAVVRYKTNALLNNPTWSATTSKGTSVSNLAGGLNIIPDLFIELPGTSGASGTRKILSASGYSGSQQSLIVTQTKNNVSIGSGSSETQLSEWEYTIKPAMSAGVKETSKIFIPQNLKNGKYKISVYTPPVTGVSSLNEAKSLKYSAMCDRKDVYVEVKGSATDDLNSHTTQ